LNIEGGEERSNLKNLLIPKGYKEFKTKQKMLSEILKT
jgi:hypothetical protein